MTENPDRRGQLYNPNAPDQQNSGSITLDYFKERYRNSAAKVYFVDLAGDYMFVPGMNLEAIHNRELIRHYQDELNSGEKQYLIVLGGAGAGKTSLLEEIGQHVHRPVVYQWFDDDLKDYLTEHGYTYQDLYDWIPRGPEWRQFNLFRVDRLQKNKEEQGDEAAYLLDGLGVIGTDDELLEALAGTLDLQPQEYESMGYVTPIDQNTVRVVVLNTDEKFKMEVYVREQVPQLPPLLVVDFFQHKYGVVFPALREIKDKNSDEYREVATQIGLEIQAYVGKMGNSQAIEYIDQQITSFTRKLKEKNPKFIQRILRRIRSLPYPTAQDEIQNYGWRRDVSNEVSEEQLWKDRYAYYVYLMLRFGFLEGNYDVVFNVFSRRGVRRVFVGLPGTSGSRYAKPNKTPPTKEAG